MPEFETKRGSSQGRTLLMHSLKRVFVATVVAALSPSVTSSQGFRPVEQPSGSVHIADTRDDLRFGGGETAGSTGLHRSVEGFVLDRRPYQLEVMVHAAGTGDSPWQSAYAFVGSRGEARRLEGLAFRLRPPHSKSYSVRYRVHCAELGWLPWVSDGAFAGTRDQSRRLEAFQIRVYPRPQLAREICVSLSLDQLRCFRSTEYGGANSVDELYLVSGVPGKAPQRHPGGDGVYEPHEFKSVDPVAVRNLADGEAFTFVLSLYDQENKKGALVKKGIYSLADRAPPRVAAAVRFFGSAVPVPVTDEAIGFVTVILRNDGGRLRATYIVPERCSLTRGPDEAKGDAHRASITSASGSVHAHLGLAGHYRFRLTASAVQLGPVRRERTDSRRKRRLVWR